MNFLEALGHLHMGECLHRDGWKKVLVRNEHYPFKVLEVSVYGGEDSSDKAMFYIFTKEDQEAMDWRVCHNGDRCHFKN